MPMRDELPCTGLGSCHRAAGGGKLYAWIVTYIARPEFEAIICFCALGLLLSAAVIHFFPDFGVLLASLEQFP
jgi:hypothetical protein